jgi:ubiquinone/menaquinone biosynthesis C-methylase UbiE
MQEQHETRATTRIIQTFEPGSSTAFPANVAYRIGKIRAAHLLEGEWLDCGCADGGYTVALVENGASHATGIDPLEDRVAQAKNRAQGIPNVRFMRASGESLPFPDECFDGVLLNEVLEHVSDEERTLQDVFRVLRPGGHIVVMSPNRWFPFEGHGMQVGPLQIPMPVPFLPWVPRTIGQRFMKARNYWPRELLDLVAQRGFNVRNVSFVLAVFEVYPWLPASLIGLYRKAMPRLEKIPLVRKLFAVSVLIIGQKPIS